MVQDKAYQRALEYATKLTEAHPTEAKYYYWKGMNHGSALTCFFGVALDNLGQTTESIDLLKFCIACDPLFVKAHLLLSDIYYKNNNLMDCIRSLNDAILAKPTNSTTYFKKGKLFYDLNSKVRTT
jgi:tetratricopeptide (TPR) repeat protein